VRRALAALVTVVVVVLVVLATGSSKPQPYRVAAVFDTAKGLVPGQLVKIAGARVGSIKDVQLTDDLKARVTFEVAHRFVPFHADASCEIKPEGFISENFVECDPGDNGKGELHEQDGVPTVPLDRTAVPVSLQDVVNTFSLPTDLRLRVLINELGIATAGRGEDLNALLRRANPALQQTRTALSILAARRQALTTAVRQTDRVLAEIAARNDDVRAFVDRAATVARTAADRRDRLGAAVHDLPATLDAIDRTLIPIRRVTDTGRPLLTDLRSAAPTLSSTLGTLSTFTHDARPAVDTLRTASDEGLRALPDATPVLRRLAQLTGTARPVMRQTSQLLTSMRDSGALDYTLRLLYSLSTVTGGWDGVSHIVTIFAGIYPQCLPAGTGTGCSHAYTAPDHGTIPVTDPSADNARALSPSQVRDLLDWMLR
jgi:virulence factor Mce-like protein